MNEESKKLLSHKEIYRAQPGVHCTFPSLVYSMEQSIYCWAAHQIIRICQLELYNLSIVGLNTECNRIKYHFPSALHIYGSKPSHMFTILCLLGLYIDSQSQKDVCKTWWCLRSVETQHNPLKANVWPYYLRYPSITIGAFPPP